MSTTNSANGDVIPRMSPENHRRYMFALELKSGSRTEYEWNPSEQTDKKMKLETDGGEWKHSLVIRRAVIGPSAKENETSLVSVEVSEPESELVTFPLVYLTQGKELQSIVDLTFPEQSFTKVKFMLAQGSGPVHLVGYHFHERVMVDDPDYEGEEAEEDVEEDEMEDIEDEKEEKEEKDKAEPVQPRLTAAAKRRLQEQNGDLKVKKMKVASENGNAENGEEEMDNESAEAADEPTKDEDAAVEK